MNNRMYGTTDLLAKALEGTWARNNAIANNVANADTPGYKRKDVAFESYLEEALAKNATPTTSELSRIKPKTYTDMTSKAYRLDGNNVDIDTEMAYQAEVQLKYNTLISQVNYNFERLKSVLNR